MRFVTICVAGLLALGGLAGCGDDEAGSGTTLNWFIFNEPSGGVQKAAQSCSEQSRGAYTINFEYLPSDADGQREQLVRRLGAEDSSIDLIGMDVVWTGEFANAGWIREVPGDRRQALTQGVFESVQASGQFEDKLYAVPIWANTQLLWYRKDLVDEPPETWDEMIEQAQELEEGGRIQVQGSRYEGLVVWINSMIASTGTQILSGPEEVALEREPTERALATIGKLASSPAADPGISTSDEDTGRLGFESGESAFMVNYPFVYPSAEGNAPEIFKQMEAAKYPRVVEGEPSAPPLGGINIGVSSFSDAGDVAWDAVECLIQPENQIEIAKAGGLPPVRSDIYDRPEIEEVYPGFADLIRESIEDAAPRPSESPAYQDLSLAIQRAVDPTEIDPEDPGPTYEELKKRVEQAVKREGLL